MKPRIILLSAFATPFRSGAEACSEEIPRALADRFDFLVVTSKLQWSLSRRETLPSGVRVLRIGFGFSFDKWLFPLLAPFVVRKFKPDIVHAVLESFAGAALILCRLLCPSVRRILTLQSTNTTLLLSAIHRSAERITAISDVLRERATQFVAGDIPLIPNGVDFRVLDAACASQKKVPGRILFVGRLESMKGVDTLLRAFALLPIDLRNCATLHIVGRGSLQPSLVSLANVLGIAPRVAFRGYIPTPEIFAEYAQAEIFCGLSRSEALGNVFLEAQGARCAIVATNVGGIPEIVREGVSGILVPIDDAATAAKAIESFLRDAGKTHSFAAAGREKALQYSWDAIAQRYASVYEEMLRAPRR